jgi:hypothetical protein
MMEMDSLGNEDASAKEGRKFVFKDRNFSVSLYMLLSLSEILSSSTGYSSASAWKEVFHICSKLILL